MTTEQPTAQRILRRRTDDRVIGGVASGLGDFLNVDPLLIRIGFVGLMVFGGLGLLLYVGGWMLIPEENSDGSIAEQILDRTGLTTRRFLIGGLLLVGGLMFVAGVNNVVGTGFASVLGAAIVVIVLGAVILRWGERGPVAAGPPVAKPSRRSDAAAAVAVMA